MSFEDNVREGRRDSLRQGRGGGTRKVAQERTKERRNGPMMIIQARRWVSSYDRGGSSGPVRTRARVEQWTKVGDEDVGHIFLPAAFRRCERRMRTPQSGGRSW